MKSDELKNKLKLIPPSPGVYIMKNPEGKVIYIGKSNNLKQRISSYFQTSSQAHSKIRKIVKNLYDFQYIITTSEMEALILECNLIKEYKPKFNVRFKDGKGYPYIKINPANPFPAMEITRKVRQDGAKYYGPYTKGLKSYLKLFMSLFPLRTCRGEVKVKRGNRPCMNYHIKRCPGPCMGEIASEEYKKIVEDASRFLEGRHRGLLERLEKKINEYIETLEFERAAVIRDQIFALRNYSEKQKVVFSSTKEEGDFIGVFREGLLGCVEIYYLREGRLIRQERFLMDLSEEDREKELLSAFIKQFYIRNTDIPGKIYLQEEAGENILEQLLNERKGNNVKLIIPKKGRKKELIEMAKENAREYLKQYILENKEAEEKSGASLFELRESLDLPVMPLLIEAFDISNISGKNAVGSMVVFEKGLPAKSFYRRYKIKTLSTPDDCKMMEEVIRRRYERIPEESSSQKLPDLILLDGGRGQLKTALKVLEEADLKIPAIALAKEEELIYQPYKKEPVKLENNSPALHLLQRIRDEAHRFAVSYHRKLRSKKISDSFLDRIGGIGKTRKKNLLEHFGSVENIRKATVKEISEVKSMNKRTAKILFKKLREKSD